MLKRAVRWGARNIKGWLQEDEPQAPRSTEYVFQRINYLLEDLSRQIGGWRSHYMWGLLNGAYLGKVLGMTRISTIEFGVAGGNGLLYLEQAAAAASKAFGIEIDVYGFDTGVGLPKPTDYRDLPNLYQENAFAMEEAKLRQNLKSANLILGPIKDTIRGFIASSPAPVGFVSFDMDYYSSTMESFQLLEADSTI